MSFSHLVVVAALLVVLLVLVLVLELGAQDSSGNGADDAVAAHLVSAEVSRSTASEGAHQASVALGLCIGVGGAVVLAWLTILVLLPLRVLVMRVSALLRELLCGCLARVRLLSVGTARR